MKKKIVAVTLAAAMAISMAGCAGNGPAKATSAETAAGTGAGEKADPASENKEAEGTGSPKEEGGTAAWADFPKKPIQIICPVKAGGDTDYNTRVIAQYLSKYLGVNVVVTNVEGGATILGMQ